MKVTKVEILPIKPQNGLMAFATIELDDQLYINSIGVHRKRDGSGYRITYPNRKIGEQSITICHPMKPELSKMIENAISRKVIELFQD